MKTTGVSCETKFGLLGFLGHPTEQVFFILVLKMGSRVSQNNQKSEFWFATNPTGFHRLDEPPEKISAL